MDSTQQLPQLDDAELRVLGSMMEKSRTTPDYYPMTVNSLLAACNQKTSRHPVVQYDTETVVNAVNTLKRRGLDIEGIRGRQLVATHHPEKGLHFRSQSRVVAPADGKRKFALQARFEFTRGIGELNRAYSPVRGGNQHRSEG